MEVNDIRDQATIKGHAGFKLDQVWIFAVCSRELADLGAAPAMDGHLKWGSRWQARHKAGHDRASNGTMEMCQLNIWDDMTGDFELLERNLGVAPSREKDNIPVVVAHG